MFSPAKPKNYFLSQVHQPFFLLGVIFAIVVMLVFLLAYKGIITLVVDSIAFHSYSLIYLVFTQFFTGFIFTTFPRFTQSNVIEKKYYLGVFTILQAGAILFVLGALFSIYLLYLALILMFVSNMLIVFKLQNIYTKSDKNLRSDPKWILTGFYFGLLGHLLYILSFLNFSVDAAAIALNLYLIFVTFAIAQRMVPFFSHSAASKNERFASTVFAGLFLKVLTIYFAFSYLESLIDIILGFYIAFEIKRWRVPFKGSAAILKILHISLYWLIASFIIGGLARLLEINFGLNFMQLDTHLLALGFLTTMLIGFGTRVTLGHAGQAPHADNITEKIFYFLQAVVVGRILLSLAAGFNMQMFWLFDLSVVLWVLLFAIWTARFGPVLISGKKI